MKERKSERGNASFSDDVSTKIGKAYFLLKVKFAERLGNWEKQLSTREKKTYLILFCLLFGFLSLNSIVSAIFEESRSQVPSIAHIEIPSVDRIKSFNISPTTNEEEIKKISDHLNYLKNDPDCSHIYNKIIVERPGLLDSLNQLEIIYQNQN